MSKLDASVNVEEMMNIAQKIDAEDENSDEATQKSVLYVVLAEVGMIRADLERLKADANA